MRLSLLAAAVALTASMFVSACSNEYEICSTDYDCCMFLYCEVSMSRLLCNQDSTT
ncbi:hypothetical protein BDR06DRAFT_964241 [Suillus hirtellus]|nr:hypothetical protein BDR06DRAFT_964241 [Suillus hirtellus]